MARGGTRRTAARIIPCTEGPSTHPPWLWVHACGFVLMWELCAQIPRCRQPLCYPLGTACPTPPHIAPPTLCTEGPPTHLVLRVGVGVGPQEGLHHWQVALARCPDEGCPVVLRDKQRQGRERSGRLRSRLGGSTTPRTPHSRPRRQLLAPHSAPGSGLPLTQEGSRTSTSTPACSSC